MLHLPKSSRYSTPRSAPRLPPLAIAGFAICACIGIVIYWHLASEYHALEERYRELQVSVSPTTISPKEFVMILFRVGEHCRAFPEEERAAYFLQQDCLSQWVQQCEFTVCLPILMNLYCLQLS